MRWELATRAGMLIASVAIALGILHWTWYGAERMAGLPEIGEDAPRMLRSYSRHRWAAVVVAIAVVVGAAVAWTEASLSGGALVLLGTLAAYIGVGRGNFTFRYLLRRDAAGHSRR